MSSYMTGRQASALELSTSHSIKQEAIFQAARARGSFLMGLSSPEREDRQLNDGGIAYVAMGESGLLDLPKRQEGLVATASLAGCTGVAAYAGLKDGGSVQFLSHYSGMDQEFSLTGEESPLVDQLRSFKYETQKRGELEGGIQYLIAYPYVVHGDDGYGERKGFPHSWHYMEQVQHAASQLGSEAQVLFLPYDDSEDHTLAAGTSQGASGVFWDGANIDFPTSFIGPSSL